jgi:hypothetical protein
MGMAPIDREGEIYIEKKEVRKALWIDEYILFVIHSFIALFKGKTSEDEGRIQI